MHRFLSSKDPKKKTRLRIISLLLSAVMAIGLAGCGSDTGSDAGSSANGEAATSDLLPVIEADEDLSTGQKTTWNCVYFGSYPQTEIVDGDFTAVDDYAVEDGDILQDADLYAQLQAADWSEDNTTEIDGTRYCRITGSDAVSASTDRVQHYRWGDVTEYHYFRYDPIKWRIVDDNDGVLTLLANRIMDGGKYYSSAEDVTWDNSDLRAWLNEDFFNTAFSTEEQESMVLANVANTPNVRYDIDCGADTEDYVYLLSDQEVYASDKAALYGFYAANGYDDASKRFTSTMYAKCRGVWWSPVEDYRGNSFWMMRTNGYTESNVSYICDFGYIYAFGTSVTCNDAGVLPVIQVDSNTCELESAGTVASDEIVKDPISSDDSQDAEAEDTETEETTEEATATDHETIEFGSYPQTEIIDSSLATAKTDTTDSSDDDSSSEVFTAVDDYALQEGDYVDDAELYAELQNADWDADDTTSIDGVKYMRINSEAANNAASGRPQHYDWADQYDTYHYFRFDPIKWRVLRQEDGHMYLMAERALDCQSYNDEDGDVCWEDCQLRTWLNTDFYDRAFSAEEQDQILETETDNLNNHYFGTACGSNTTDHVYLMAEEDTFYTEKSVENGFSIVDYGEDPARQLTSTLFAKCRGCWWAPEDEVAGHCFWILRTNGYNNHNTVYLDEHGDMYNRGTYTTTSDAGIVPAICIDADSVE